MNFKKLEEKALQLAPDERAELAQRLLLSLDEETEEQIGLEWLAEANRRAKEIDEGLVQPIPAEEVRRKAQALLR